MSAVFTSPEEAIQADVASFTMVLAIWLVTLSRREASEFIKRSGKGAKLQVNWKGVIGVYKHVSIP